MNQRLEQDIAAALHQLSQDQLLDVKRYVERLRSSKQNYPLIEDEELDMLLKVMAKDCNHH